MMRFTLLVVLLTLLVPGPTTAQDRVWTRQVGSGWLGISYETTWVQRDERCEPRLMIDHVVQGSPAERAGLRPGDAIMALSGERFQPADLQRLAARLSPGDSLSLVLQRDGRERKVVAVAGQRPERVASLFVLRSRSGLESTSAPIVEFRGDTLTARNLEEAPPPEGLRGYWLARGGETEFRRLRDWRRGDELDQRVEALLRCAEEEEARPVRVDLVRLQQRADSLRVRYAEGVLARQREGEASGRVDESRSLTFIGEDGSGRRTVHVEEVGPTGYVFRVEDHVLAGLRGLAGAELTALEPELADYFENVRAGLLVLRVAPGTLADRAGLRPGDVVTRADGQAVEAVAELRGLLARPDASIELDVVRKGRRRTITLRPR